MGNHKEEVFSYIDELGWNVLPVSNKKTEAIGSWKGRVLVNWKQYQTTKAPKDILIPHMDNGGCNYAVICGDISGVIVIDTDSEEATQKVKDLGFWGTTPTVKTNKGYHLYFKYEPGIISNSKIEIDGKKYDIDTRANNNGLATIPPSINPDNGYQYAWVKGMTPHDIPFASFPEVMKKWCVKKEPAPMSQAAKEYMESNPEAYKGSLQDVKNVNIFSLADKLGMDMGKLTRKDQIMCPSGHDTTPSFTFYRDSNSFNCFGCGSGGSTIDLVMMIRSCSSGEAIKYIRENYGIDNPYEKKNVVESPRAEAKKEIIEEPIGEEEEEIIDEEPVSRNIYEILDQITKAIKSISFKGIFDKEYRRNEDEKIIGLDYISISVRNFHKQLKNLKFKVMFQNGFYYIYNGKWWVTVEAGDIKLLLSMVAGKQGCPPKFLTRVTFADKLFDQFKLNFYRTNVLEQEPGVRINLLNGTIHVGDNSIELKPHNHKDFLKYILDFNYEDGDLDPDSLFLKFINRTLPQKSVQDSLQEYAGYIFTKNDDLKLEKMLVLLGGGQNGKSVFFDVINALLGDENISNFSSKDLSEEHYRAMITGKLLNYSSEFGKGIESETLKQLASGEKISARMKYGHPFIAKNYARIAFNANDLPKNVENNVAYFRRFLIVPFNQTITEEEKDPQLAKKIIKTEIHEVFKWAIIGLRRIMETKKFTHSKEMKDVMDNYKRDTDSSLRFVEESEELIDLLNKNELAQAGKWLYLKEIYGLYKDFCKEDNYKPAGKKTFSSRLEKLENVEKKRDQTGIKFLIPRERMYQHDEEELEDF